MFSCLQSKRGAGARYLKGANGEGEEHHADQREFWEEHEKDFADADLSREVRAAGRAGPNFRKLSKPAGPGT